MKRYTRHDLQKMYEEASQELTELIHQKISSLPDQTQEEPVVKKKLSFSAAGIIAIVIALMAAAYAATALYRVVTWKGEITRTVDSTETPVSLAEENPYLQEQTDSLRQFMLDVPDDETVFAWYESDGKITASELHRKQITITSFEKFKQYMTGTQDLTLPSWYPDEDVSSCRAVIYMDCKAFGKYDLLENHCNGNMKYKRFLIDDSDSLITGYRLELSLKDGSLVTVNAYLASMVSSSEEALMLREGETAEKIDIGGMSDALLIKAQGPDTQVNLIMRRNLIEPVRWKLLPYNNYVTSDDNNYYNEEYIYVWGHKIVNPDIVTKLFQGE